MARITFRQTVVRGTSGDDTLEGGAGPNRLVGSSGNDRLIAAWDDLMSTPSGTLVYDGGTGVDTLDFSRLDRAIGVDLYFGPYVYLNYQRDVWGNSVHFNPNNGDRLTGAVSGIENLIGSEFSDYLQGSSGNNTIQGRGGDDYISSQRGTDIVIGGAGNDYIVIGSHRSTVTGDDDADLFTVGNDIFTVIGHDAGIFASARITDFDLRADDSDQQYDQFHFSNYQQITFGSNDAGELVAYRWSQGSLIGEVIFSGLKLADAHMVPVFSFDYSTSGAQPVPYQPDIIW